MFWPISRFAQGVNVRERGPKCMKTLTEVLHEYNLELPLRNLAAAAAQEWQSIKG